MMKTIDRTPSKFRSVISLCVFALATQNTEAGTRKVRLPPWSRPQRCEPLLARPASSASRPLDDQTALKQLVGAVRTLKDQPGWVDVVNDYLIPATQSPTSNLILSLVGPTNVGKSTIFDSLQVIKDPLQHADLRNPSPVSFNAESTARTVVMFDSEMFDEQGNFDLRFRATERWRDYAQVEQPGPTLVFPVRNFYKTLIFADTPSFTAPSSRPDVRQEIRISDILIYVFSNANYAEDSILSFVKQQMRETGPRDMILVYNVNAAIPKATLEQHFATVSSKILDLVADRSALPLNVIGAYHLVHSEKVASGEEPANFSPLEGYPPLRDLLSELDANSSSYRRQILNLSLQFVLDRAVQTLKDTDLLEAELSFSEHVFDIYLKHLIHESIAQIPYQQLASQLEHAWNRQARGLRGFALWIARPLEMAGLYGSRNPDLSPALNEINRYLDNLIDAVVSRFRLAVAEGAVRMPEAAFEASGLTKEVDALRARYDDLTNAPSVQRKGDRYEIQLPKSGPAVRYFQRYLARHWADVVPEIKRDVDENFTNLTMQIQSQLQQLVKSQSLPRRVAQGALTGFAILPAMAAVSYMAYRGTALIEVQTLASIFGAHLAARLFLGLNERSLRREWNSSVRRWFEERQPPRLIEILQRHVRLRPTDESINIDRQALTEAIHSLQTTGIIPK